ncbi:MAG TPA: hypothetical protein VK062_04705, partial [Burkholderiaceae bacterium]|nr:hypothetical protein [Burkholderiaceae bacterium]
MKHPIINTPFLLPRLLAAVAFTAMAAGGASFAQAQGISESEARQRYQQDIERCRSSGLSAEQQRTCQREAGAALQEAQRNRLVTGSGSFDANQRARCDRLTGTQREDCLTLMSDPNATVRGSVEGGGVIRETTITIPASGAGMGTGTGSGAGMGSGAG